jgi:hypothetical protein
MDAFVTERSYLAGKNLLLASRPLLSADSERRSD